MSMPQLLLVQTRNAYPVRTSATPRVTLTQAVPTADVATLAKLAALLSVHENAAATADRSSHQHFIQGDLIWAAASGATATSERDAAAGVRRLMAAVTAASGERVVPAVVSRVRHPRTVQSTVAAQPAKRTSARGWRRILCITTHTIRHTKMPATRG
jgi:hypothetical protein